MSIAANLQAILAKIVQDETIYGRTAGSVELLAASKNQPVEKIAEAFAAGQRRFGENYVQEALHKMKALPDNNIEWHFIGLIQHNKIKKIAEHFAWVHSVSSAKIAQRLHESRSASLPPLNICIEVNVNSEPTKSGVALHEVRELLDCCKPLTHLKVRGLMTIPAPTTDFAKQRMAFHQIYELWKNLNQDGYALDTLSMGMSQDFSAAIAEGATLIRIGTALFGPRPSKKP